MIISSVIQRIATQQETVKPDSIEDMIFMMECELNLSRYQLPVLSEKYEEQLYSSSFKFKKPMNELNADFPLENDHLHIVIELSNTHLVITNVNLIGDAPRFLKENVFLFSNEDVLKSFKNLASFIATSLYDFFKIIGSPSKTSLQISLILGSCLRINHTRDPQLLRLYLSFLEKKNLDIFSNSLKNKNIHPTIIELYSDAESIVSIESFLEPHTKIVCVLSNEIDLSSETIQFGIGLSFPHKEIIQQNFKPEKYRFRNSQDSKKLSLNSLETVLQSPFDGYFLCSIIKGILRCLKPLQIISKENHENSFSYLEKLDFELITSIVK